MLGLRSHGADMALAGVGALLFGLVGFHAASPTIEAHACVVVHHYGRVIGVVDDRGVYVAHIRVIGEVSAFPAAALKPQTTVAKAIINAAIKADVRSPIAGVEQKGAAAPTP